MFVIDRGNLYEMILSKGVGRLYLMQPPGRRGRAARRLLERAAVLLRDQQIVQLAMLIVKSRARVFWDGSVASRLDELAEVVELIEQMLREGKVDDARQLAALARRGRVWAIAYAAQVAQKEGGER